MKRLLFLLLTFLPFYLAKADSSPKYEMRGAWLVTAYGIDWPGVKGQTAEIAGKQKAQLDTMLTRISRAGINAVFFQVRPMADAFYDSSLEPWSSFLTGSRGTKPAFDPLKFCVERCHALGMECHAWINPFRVGNKLPATSRDKSSSHLWMTNRVNQQTMTIFNPALEETRQHLCNVCREIATNYDIDGIVFDDYFYNPEFLAEDDSASDWDLFRISTKDKTIADWRRDNINRAIEDVHKLLAGIKGGKIRFGVSPQGIAGGNGAHADVGVPSPVSYGVVTADSQYTKIYSDPVYWLRNGLIDYVSPQIYWNCDNRKHPFDALCHWWNDVAHMFGRHCYASINLAPFAGDNSRANRDERLHQVECNRQFAHAGAPGSVFYSASYISGPKTTGFGNDLRSQLFASPALMPPMTWKQGATPLSIANLHRADNRLSWTACGDSRYVVYAIPNSVTITDAVSTSANGFQSDYIIAILYTNSFNIPAKYRVGYRLAVAPYDRYGNEWDATFVK